MTNTPKTLAEMWDSYAHFLTQESQGDVELEPGYAEAMVEVIKARGRSFFCGAAAVIVCLEAGATIDQLKDELEQCIDTWRDEGEDG